MYKVQICEQVLLSFITFPSTKEFVFEFVSAVKEK